MEFTELSLQAGKGSESNLRMKRKWSAEEVVAAPIVDLQLHNPLPSDWEQCLDLQSGKMYYVNKKTSRKSWTKPEEQKLDLELNISTAGSSSSIGYNYFKDYDYFSSSPSSLSSGVNSSNMVALACANCHLLVILSRSSPSCPNCKYVHSLNESSTDPKSSSPWPI